MNSLIKVEINKVTKETKGTELIQQTCLKTKTNLEIKFTEKDIGFQEDIFSDITLMELEGEKIASFMVTVEGAKALGRVINRSVASFNRLGITISDMDWESNAGVIEVKGDLTTADMPYLVELFLRLTQRATKAISHTHHPLTLFDLKQTIGLVYDIKQSTEGAEDFNSWFLMRELAILEEEKELKAIEKKIKSDALKEKRKEQKREENPQSGPLATPAARKKTAKKAGKAAQAKAKEKNALKPASTAVITEIKSPGLSKAKLTPQ